MTFMDWLRSNSDNFQQPFFMYKSSNELRYISELLNNEEIAQWHCFKPVFIYAQTGTGKTSFNHQILNRSLQRGEKLLFLSNRRSLLAQQQQTFANDELLYRGISQPKRILNESLTEKGKNGFTQIGSVTMQLYQNLVDPKAISDWSNFKYIICDECHFFTSDATFNKFTDEILENIINYGSNAIRIYISATITTAFAPIAFNEYLSLQRRYGQNARMQICFYHLAKVDYSYIKDIYTYSNLLDLKNRIKETYKTEKWLIFVASKEKGKNLLTTLIDEGVSKSDCSFIFSSQTNDTMEVKKNLTETESFKERILITTATLDNGINVNDESVKNIVIDDILDRNEFMQMLGRKRIDANQYINLHIKKYSNQQVRSVLCSYVNQLVRLLAMDTKSEIQKKVTDNYNECKPKVMDDSYTYTYNYCVIYELIQRIDELIQFLQISENKIFEWRENEIKDSWKELYHSYKDPNKVTSRFIWAQNITDILEFQPFKRERLQALLSRSPQAVGYTFGDTFYNYIEAINTTPISSNIKDSIDLQLSWLKLNGREVKDIEELNKSKYRSNDDVVTLLKSKVIKAKFYPKSYEEFKAMKKEKVNPEIVKKAIARNSSEFEALENYVQKAKDSVLSDNLSNTKPQSIQIGDVECHIYSRPFPREYAYFIFQIKA